MEPSGIFDVDEFFDALHEEPLDKWYEIGNVIAIVDAKLEKELSPGADYLLASEVADAGCVLLSRSQDAAPDEIQSTKEHLNRALEQIQCKRRLDAEILDGNWDKLTDEDMEKILNCGYVAEDYVKESYAEGGGFDSLFFMNVHMSEEKLKETAEKLLTDPSCGDVFRVKGFLKKEDGQWLELNATRHETCIQPTKLGQEIMIVIGEKLNKEVIDGYWK